MTHRHLSFRFFAVLGACIAYAFAVAAPAVAAVAAPAVAAVHRHVVEPIGRYFERALTREPNGLEYAAIRGAASARTMTASQTRLFAGRRADRVVGAPAMAFDMGIPRQGGLIAC